MNSIARRLKHFFLVEILVIVSFFIGALTTTANLVEDQPICCSAECVNAVTKMLSDMDPKIDPCEDFYQYACGGYEAATELTADEMMASPIVTMDRRVREEFLVPVITNIDQDTANEEQSPLVRKVIRDLSTFYKSCVDLDARIAVETKPLMNEINEKFTNSPMVKNCPYPTESSFENVEQIMALVDSYPVSIGHEPNIVENTDEYVVVFGVSKKSLFPVNAVLSREEKKQAILSVYEEYYTKIKNFFNISDQILLNAISFDKELAKIIGSNTIVNPEESYKVFTLHNLCTKFPLIKLDQALDRYFEQVINISVNPYTPETKVLVQDYQNLFRILGFYSSILQNDTMIHNFIDWSYFLRIVDGARRLGYQIVPVSFPGKENKDVKEECINSIAHSTYFKPYLNYRMEIWSEMSRRRPKIKKMIDEIIMVAKDSFKDMAWLDESTKKNAIKKMEKMKIEAGVPESIYEFEKFYETTKRLGLNIEFDVTNFAKNQMILNVLDQKIRFIFYLLSREANNQDRDFLETISRGYFVANAFYSTEENRVMIMSGIAREPVFYDRGADLFSYARLGYAIGHEITHAFDIEGSASGPDGSFLKWWSEETRKKYLDNMQCFINQMDEFNFKDLKGNGNFTIEENYADNFGLYLAFSAAEKMIQKGNIRSMFAGTKESWQKIFFTSFAQFHCNVMKPVYLQKMAVLDRHPLSAMRVWSAISNHEAFAKNFNCPLGSPMNPTTKCV